MGLRWVRVEPSKSMCQVKLPLFSSGEHGQSIALAGEEYCILPAAHDGPHRGPHGQLIHNTEGARRKFERGEF